MRAHLVTISAALLIGFAANGAPLVQTATSGAGTKPWAPARTSWGDPDFQGVFSNGDEYTTPLERPDTLAGRRLEDITGQELLSVRRAQLAAVIDALPGGRVRGPDAWWVQNLNVANSRQAWLVVDPADGKIPALTPDGQRRAARRVRSSFVGGPFDGPEDFSLLDRCISRSVPGSMIPVMYGNTYQITQAPGFVVITYEIIHEARVISLNGRPHVGPGIRQHMGDAAAYRGANAATLHIVERFTRPAPDRLAWTATIEDPSTWTRPWSIGMTLTADPQPVLAYDCHEGNYGLKNILSAARADEKAGATGSSGPGGDPSAPADER
jgi:hypothetical protein